MALWGKTPKPGLPPPDFVGSPKALVLGLMAHSLGQLEPLILLATFIRELLPQ